LPAGKWPPDHYTLLGLRPGEGDVARIDHEVHARLAKLRCYQIAHPELASEAMNRLAQAFLCLSDPAARRAYDSEVGATTSLPSVGENGPTMTANAPVPSELSWQGAAPPPVRVEAHTPTEERPTPGAGPETATAPTVATAATAPVAQPADQVYETAHKSPAARRGIGTPAALLDRVVQTRALLLVWERLGKFLSKPQRRLTRMTEEKELTKRLGELSELMDDFPPLLGQPGQPGYRVVALAHLGMTPVMFKMLDANQRQALAQDWIAGRVVLLAHRQFLRQEVKAVRRQTQLGRAIRAGRALLNDHPAWVVSTVLIIGMVALFFSLS
jgi:hypothetical protein